MKYINERILRELGINWPSLTDVIGDATALIAENKISQPVKPYLRFNNPVNRIIAMPAWIGGKFNTAGIKWIASFPGNIARSVKRAHSVIILNDAETGIPVTMINTAVISGIRTAAVSGFVLSQYLKCNDTGTFAAGIIGFGPIGQLHLQMLTGCFKAKIKEYFIFDINEIDDAVIAKYRDVCTITVCKTWQEVYEKTNLFITCTVSKERYINLAPKKGGVYLNVSLRDFDPGFVTNTDVNVVDSWEEICRENTDIENAHQQYGLQKKDVMEITDILSPGALSGLGGKSFMFNPMGMAVYDMAVAGYYNNLAITQNCFIQLED